MTDEIDPSQLTKLTVNVAKPNIQALWRASEMSGDSRTDVVNRALGIYAWLYEHVWLPGHQVFIRDKKTRKIREVVFPEPFREDGK